MKKPRIKSPKISKALKAKHHERIVNNIQTLVDYVYIRKYSNSLKLLMQNHPNGISDGMIAKILKIKTSDLTQIFNKILIKLKTNLIKEE